MINKKKSMHALTFMELNYKNISWFVCVCMYGIHFIFSISIYSRERFR